MERRAVQLALCVLCLFGGVVTAAAVPAYPYPVKVKTANGKEVRISLRGDEFRKFAVTKDGYTLLADSAGWWYAMETAGGVVVKSSFRLMADEDEASDLVAFKKLCRKGLMPERTGRRALRKSAGRNAAKSSSPIVGERRALVILMQFQDRVFHKQREDFEALFNTLDYHREDAYGSVRDYYRFASQGQLDYISDVYGPYTADYPMRYYGGNSMNGSDMHPQELCAEALMRLPEDIDFSVYDNDGDGLVDNVHIIYAGYGEESGASADAIWAHEYPHRIPLRTSDGYSFAGYSCSPELRENQGADITFIGVICHELGHALGAMDYYDTNYAVGGEYAGTGQWDIMAEGSWNGKGRMPSNFNPYVRSTVFGWNRQEPLEGNMHISLPRMETDNAEQTVVYRMETGSDGDYFLLENRQQHLFDAALPGAGLMIYHVHPDVERFQATNTVNATSPQGLYPVCAAYSEPGQKRYGQINSAGCPFPGQGVVTAFSAETSPAAVAWNGSAARVALAHITQNNGSGSVAFFTGHGGAIGPEAPEGQVERQLVYQESFEENVKERMEIKTMAGRQAWQTYRRGDFFVDSDLLPDPTEGRGMLILLSGKGEAISESEIVSPDIEVEPGVNYSLLLDLCCQSNAADDVTAFALYVEDEYGEYNLFTLKEVAEEWTTVELPLTFASGYFRYKLYGRVDAGKILVDNIRLCKEHPASAQVPRCGRNNKVGCVYDLNGVAGASGPVKGVDAFRGIRIVRTTDGDIYKVLCR